MVKLLPYILFEKYINILALEMASHAGNRHCANCIDALTVIGISSFDIYIWLAYTVLKNSSIYKNKSTFLWNFVIIWTRRIFGTARRSSQRVTCCLDNMWTRSPQRDKLDRRLSHYVEYSRVCKKHQHSVRIVVFGHKNIREQKISISYLFEKSYMNPALTTFF